MYPYDESETESSVHKPQHKLQRLVEDPPYWREQDPEFRSYIDNGFKSAYGDNAAETDATGRTIDPAPKPVAIPPFKPSVTLTVPPPPLEPATAPMMIGICVPS